MTAIDPTTDIFAEIERLKRERKAVILAHYYQDPDIQDIADHLGDSAGSGSQGGGGAGGGGDPVLRGPLHG